MVKRHRKKDTWVYSGNKFRSKRRAETVRGPGGHKVRMRLSEEKVGGRWEPFYSMEGSVKGKYRRRRRRR